MDEEMEDTYEYTFTAVEIDLDYEFDAARFFDFCSEETPAEAREAERWFNSAGSYPPSPFVAKLVPREDLLLETVNTSPKSKNEYDMSLSESDSDVDVNEDDDARDGETSVDVQASNIQKFQKQIQKIRSGLEFYNHMIKDNFKTKTKASVKPSFPRSSTLMKPTASQLAKQNKPHQLGGLRFQKSLAEKNQKSSGNHCVNEVQAPKRQKLEGGHMCKVGETKQQINFTHKEPKKLIMQDGTGDINSMQAKLRITIPREPDLETAHRAQRMRSKTSKETENVTSTVPRFKARPLNRKILESPSLLLPKRSTPQLPEFQEFHLRTLERATQHTSATSTSTVPCSNSDKVLHKWSANSTAECGKIEPRRPKLMNTLKDACELSHTFKALPLNKKIFTSKGDIGVFRNTKRETTVPMEFNFQTEKRVHNPPIELFNKLSLASDPQPSARSQLKPPRPTCSTKVLKENRGGFVPQAHEIKHAAREKLLWSGRKQNQSSSDDRTTLVWREAESVKQRWQDD